MGSRRSSNAGATICCCSGADGELCFGAIPLGERAGSVVPGREAVSLVPAVSPLPAVGGGDRPRRAGTKPASPPPPGPHALNDTSNTENTDARTLMTSHYHEKSESGSREVDTVDRPKAG